MNINDWAFQLLLLLPISLVSAAAVSSVFVPAVNAAEVPDGHLAPDLSHEHEQAGYKVKDNKFYMERIVQSQWEKQRRWSKTFLRKKKRLQAANFAKLSFVSIGAVAQVAATQVPAQYKATTSFVGGVCVGVGAYVKNNYITKDQVKDMVMSFYIAQAIKSEICKFRAKAGPYGKAGSSKALQNLKDTCINLSKLAPYDKEFLTMQKDHKAVPVPMATRDDYTVNRIDRVIDNLYIKSARDSDRKGALCSRIEDVLLGAGTLAGIGATQQFPGPIQKVVDGLMGWTGALTTISTAFANHHAKMKYEEIANQYYDAAGQLRELKDNWPEGALKAGDAGWDDHIQKCERVILSTVEEFARDRTGNKDLMFTKKKAKDSPSKMKFQAKVWNPNVLCGTDETGSYVASQRAKWLMDNDKLSKKDAQARVMAEFPENF